LLHHTDRGSQYAAVAYRLELEGVEAIASMSRKADCYDSAAMESFFATLRKELVYRRRWSTREEARAELFGGSRADTASVAFTPRSTIAARRSTKTKPISHQTRVHQIGVSPNEYTSVGGVAQTYDTNGNLIADRTNTYTFDAENRMVSAGTPPGSATYAYDPFMRRTRKIVAGILTSFLWTGGSLLAEYDAAGARGVRYLRDGTFAPVQVGLGPGPTEPRHDVSIDNLDEPRVMSSAGGAMVWRTAYEALGSHAIEPGSAVGLNLRAPGQYFDSETALHYNWFRFYRPGSGRYTGPDPIRKEFNATLYTYTFNSPIDSSDPTGRCTNTVDCEIERGGGNAKALLEMEGVGDAAKAVELGIAAGTGAGIVAIEASKGDEADDPNCPVDSPIKVNPPLPEPVDPGTLTPETGTPDNSLPGDLNPSPNPPPDSSLAVKAAFVVVRLIQLAERVFGN